MIEMLFITMYFIQMVLKKILIIKKLQQNIQILHLKEHYNKFVQDYIYIWELM